MNRMTFLALRAGGREDLPGHLDRRGAAQGGLDHIFAGFGEGGVLDPIGRAFAVLPGQESGRLGENALGVLSVDGHRNGGGIRDHGELDLEVEFGAGENLRAVQRIDDLAEGRAGQTWRYRPGQAQRDRHDPPPKLWKPYPPPLNPCAVGILGTAMTVERKGCVKIMTAAAELRGGRQPFPTRAAIGAKLWR